MTLLVVGGNERMKQDYISLGKKRGYKIKVILNMSSKVSKNIGTPGAIVMFTSTMSHKLKDVIETQAKRKNIPIIRHFNSSKVSFIECINKIEECNGRCEECIHSFKKSNNII